MFFTVFSSGVPFNNPGFRPLLHASTNLVTHVSRMLPTNFVLRLVSRNVAQTTEVSNLIFVSYAKVCHRAKLSHYFVIAHQTGFSFFLVEVDLAVFTMLVQYGSKVGLVKKKKKSTVTKAFI